MTVSVVIDKSAAGVPACLRAGLNEARLLSYICEGSVAVIAVKRILSVVGDKQIFIAIVVEIANTTGLSPACAVLEARAFCDIGKGTVTIVFK